MSYIDRVGCICASRHATAPVVTASFDSMDFLTPVRIGESITLRATVTWTGQTSIETQVIVESENIDTGERKVTGVCFLSYVAADADGKPIPVPAVQPETEVEHFQYIRGGERTEYRKKRRMAMPKR